MIESFQAKVIFFLIMGYLLWKWVLKDFIEDWGCRIIVRNHMKQAHFQERLEQIRKEYKLIHSNETPTPEHIKHYYQQYLESWENQDEWTTENPMSFEKFEKSAKEYGYKFLINMKG